MIDIKNVLEVINEVLVLPIAIITFFLLIYIAGYLWKKDPDVVRSRIFLKYNEIKKAFVLFGLFAFVLVMHVSLIYIPHFFSWGYPSFIEDLQKVLGLFLVLILITFSLLIYRGLMDSSDY
jgi:hypothetical protein